MIKTYCDICSREVKKEELIWLRFFKPHGQNEEFNSTAPTMDICSKCYRKIMTSKMLTPEVTAPILKQAEKIAKEAVKETITIPIKEALPEKTEDPIDLKAIEKKLSKSAKRPTKEEVPDPEKKTRNDNIDDGKIWALAHAKNPWTIEKIAEECRCSTATVYNHLKRMREEKGEY